ncbi:MAG: T9SS type A sorting domain-containing protein [Bacteroidota bacterium]
MRNYNFIFGRYPFWMIFCIQIFFQQNFFADEPDTLWTKHFHYDGWEHFYSVKQTADSGFIAVGERIPFNNTSYKDVFLVKTDKEGNLLWRKLIGSNRAREYGNDIIEMKNFDNDLIIVGRYANITIPGSEEVHNALVVRISSDGNIKWLNGFDNFGQLESAISVTPTFDDCFLLAAYNWFLKDGIFDQNIWLVKFNSLGASLWSKEFDMGFNIHEYPAKVIQTSDSGFVVAGNINFQFASPWHDLLLFKTDKSGNFLWKKIYGGAGYDNAADIIQLNDGGFIISGKYRKSDGNGQLWLLRTDQYGDTLWTKTYGGDNSEWARSMALTHDGGFIMAGVTESFGNGFWDVWILRTDSLGNELWSKTFGDSYPDEAYSIQQTYDGGYIIAGIYTDLSPEKSRDGYLIRLAPETITTVKENVNTDPKSFQLSQNYPNPFNPKTVIKFQVPSSKFVKLQIHDLLGREVQTLIDAPMLAGKHEVTFNGSGLPSGVYIYTLKVNEFSQSRKMLLLK